MASAELILGVDPGSLRTGFGLIECNAGRIRHVTHGTIISNQKEPISNRLRDIACDLTTILEKYRPTKAAVEDIFLFNNPRSALVLGQARGAVLAVLGLQGLSIETLSPTRVKSLICGRGKAQKFQVAQIVAIELGIPVPKSQDSSDALAIALALAHDIKLK